MRACSPARTFTNGTDYNESPCLLVGTSQGSTLVVNLFIPNEQRVQQSVFAAPVGGTLFRNTGGRLMCTAVLDKTGPLLAAAVESNKKSADDKLKNRSALIKPLLRKRFSTRQSACGACEQRGR